jgi:hypothetical protein
VRTLQRGRVYENVLLLANFVNIVVPPLPLSFSGGIPSHLKPRALADTLGLPQDSTILKPRVTLGFRD